MLSGHDRGQIEQLLTAWRDASLPAQAIGPTRANVERLHDVERQEHELGVEQREVMARVAELVSDGALDLQGAIAEYHESTLWHSASGATSSARRGPAVAMAAKAAIAARIEASLASLPPVLLQAASHLVQEVVKLAPQVEGKTREEAGGTKAGQKVLERLDYQGDLGKQHANLCRVSEALESLGHAVPKVSGLDPRVGPLELAGVEPEEGGANA